jgi:hypothetical protein
MKQLVVHRNYSSIVNFQMEISTIFQGIFGIFAVFQIVYLFHDFSWNPGLKMVVFNTHVRRMNRSMKHWWSDSYEGEVKYLENDPSQCHPVHRELHMYCPGPKSGPVW